MITVIFWHVTTVDYGGSELKPLAPVPQSQSGWGLLQVLLNKDKPVGAHFMQCAVWFSVTALGIRWGAGGHHCTDYNTVLGFPSYTASILPLCWYLCRQTRRTCGMVEATQYPDSV